MKVSYTIDETRTKKAMKKYARRVIWKRRFHTACKWFKDNKEIVLVLGPAAIGLTTVVIKGGIKLATAGFRHINLHEEKKLKDFYCYDRSLGHYWKLRRELTNREWTEIDKRKKNGERMGDILNELHVLK